MATIAELAEDRTVEGVFAVTKKERRRTRTGAAYLALELADASGRVEARVWNDVDLLDRRFEEGDAVHVLGRVESFGGKLQVQVRAVEPAEDADPAELTPSLRRDADELDGFFDFLASEISHSGLAALVDSFVRDPDIRASLRALAERGNSTEKARTDTLAEINRILGRSAGTRRLEPKGDGTFARSFVRDPDIRASLRALPAAGGDGHHGYAGGLLEHTVGVATLCRETAQLHPRLRSDLLLTAALLHDVGRARELTRGPSFRQTEEGRLLGHVHLGLRMIEERTENLDSAVLAELLHAIACHHDRPAARTAEAAVLYHANQLDAQAATRPVGDS
jgi:3'-5' exoribonuclease